MKRKAFYAAACLSLLLTGCITNGTKPTVEETTVAEATTEAETQAKEEQDEATFDDIFIQEIKSDVESGDYDGAIELAREHRDELKSLTVDSWMSTGNGDGYGVYKVTLMVAGKDGTLRQEHHKYMLYIGAYQDGIRIGQAIWMEMGNGSTRIYYGNWEDDAPSGETVYYTSPDGGYEGPNPRTINLVDGLYDGVLPVDDENTITFASGKIQYIRYDEKTGVYVFDEKDGKTWGNKNEEVIDTVYGAPGFGENPY